MATGGPHNPPSSSRTKPWARLQRRPRRKSRRLRGRAAGRRLAHPLGQAKVEGGQEPARNLRT
eukprot:5710444-Pyramimonas_sp.AAC.1